MARIIRADQVKIDGKRQIGRQTICHQQQTGPGPARVRMVQTNAQYSIIEVTCTCGQKILIRCEHGPS